MHRSFAPKKRFLAFAILSLSFCVGTIGQASELSGAQVHQLVSVTIKPVMEKYRIPGMTVGLLLRDQVYIFNYGLASVADRRPVTDATLFEIGSISKTFTSTLATYAEVTGKLKLSDTVADHLPKVAGTDFGRLQLYHLGTHTMGGMPLQVPDEIHNHDQLLSYLRRWKPTYDAGSIRTYANPGIGMLGVIAAKSLGKDFPAALNQTVLQALGLKNTYLKVPAEKLEHYAFGYTKELSPVRMNPGMLADEAYGIKSTAGDLLLYMQASMAMLTLDKSMQAALDNTHRPYFNAGDMEQALIWETYALPIDLKALQKGNSSDTAFTPMPVTPLVNRGMPDPKVWINKTGATNGFGAYLAFIPSQHFGIVVLANKNYPNEERVKIAYSLYQALLR